MKRGVKRLFKLWGYLQYRCDRELTRIEKRDGCIMCGRPGCCRHFHVEVF
jgi:hypothetical protein